MTKQRLLWFITTALVVIWLAWAGILIWLDTTWYLKLFVTLTIALSSVAIWLHHRLLPNRKIQAIEQLARSIEQRHANLLDPLPISNLPKEILPLVNALNHLLQREADRVQLDHEFSSEASHELRTPLAGIRLQVQIAQRSKDSAQRDKALNHAIKSIDRSTRLVEQLLTLSRLTRRQTKLSTSPVDLESLCQKVSADYLQQAGQRNIQLNFALPNKLPPVEADGDALETLLKNLLDNALRYTPQNGEIQLSATLSNNGKTTTLAVADSGPGIPHEQQALVLAPFQKAADGRKRGSGLGLAIVNRIAELHNSKLELADSMLGGLVVSLKLPVTTYEMG